MARAFQEFEHQHLHPLAHAVPMAAVVLPLPGPVFTIMRPRRMSAMPILLDRSGPPPRPRLRPQLGISMSTIGQPTSPVDIRAERTGRYVSISQPVSRFRGGTPVAPQPTMIARYEKDKQRVRQFSRSP
jgi:hypothetical protein